MTFFFVSSDIIQKIKVGGSTSKEELVKEGMEGGRQEDSEKLRNIRKAS